ncbi:MAG: alpha/beta fold hydrolase [Janthinobacterium lividum]
MKQFFLAAGLGISGLAAQAQLQRGPQPAVRVAANTIFLQKVGVAPYAGRPYRLTMRAQADTAGGNWASLGVIYSANGRLGGSADLYSQKSLNRVRSAQWLTYTIAGKLPARVDTVILTPNVRGNGRFAFDDFRLEVQQPGGAWLPVPLPNGDFEAPAPTDSSATRLPPGWRPVAPVAGYTYRRATEASGNHYLLLRGTGIVDYGHHRAAGHYQLANGVRLYYETYGQGPPLLLLHGNGESINSFRYQIAEFARHYQVIALDTRDHGQSATTKGPLTYDLFAADVLALLDALHLPAVRIVGWSDGGNTGLSLALHYPGRVQALVTMGANLFADTTAIDGQLLRYVQQARHHGPERNRRLNALMADYPQLSPAGLAAIAAPTLVLAGEKDVIKEAHTRLIAASIPKAQLVILPGLTHYAPQENPALFNKTVLDFLAAH